MRRRLSLIEHKRLRAEIEQLRVEFGPSLSWRASYELWLAALMMRIAAWLRRMRGERA